MKIKESKELVRIIKREPLSILIILSIFILPVVFWEWTRFFPRSLSILIVIIIIILWIFALYRLRIELIIYRRKVILLNYLKKEKRHSIYHLTKEWAAKDEFAEKNINTLLFEYPDIFKRVKVKRENEYVDGVGLVPESTDKK